MKKNIPPMTVSRWDGCLLPRDEIKTSLLYLAHKTGKTVRFCMYPGEPRYSPKVIHVFVCTQDNGLGDAGVRAVTIHGQDYVLANAQRSFCLELKGEYILDDTNTTIAVVDRNNIIIRFEITGADNDVARAVLAYVVEKAIPLLRLDVEEYAESRSNETAEGRIIPIVPRLLIELQKLRLAARSDQEYIFATERGTRHRNNLPRQLRGT